MTSLLGLFRPSLPALLRAAQSELERHASPAACAPSVVWQTLTEDLASFDQRMLAARERLPAHARLIAACRTHPDSLPGVTLAQMPDKLFELLHPQARSRYRCASGGRGSGKSHSFATAIVLLALSKRVRILCAREIMRSLRESVHHLLCDKIDAFGLAPYFDITDRAITCTATGAEVIFTGLFANVAQLKSLENIGLCWIEESESATARSLEILAPTVRAGGSEIWLTMNPDAADAPAMQFVDGTRPDTRHVHVTFADNPWFPHSLEGERAYLQRVDDDAYRHVWLGECRTASNATVFAGKYVVQDFTPAGDWSGPYFGADWGFSQDPSTLVKCWIHERKLYIEHEAYAIGCDIDRTPALFDQVPDARRYAIRADCARPETISYMQRNGYPRVTAVAKWSGSVEDGVAHLRSYEQIIVHPRCTHAAEEMRLYSFRVDRLTGDVLPDILDKNNHCIDSLRYALGPLIRRAGMGFYEFAMSEAEKMRVTA